MTTQPQDAAAAVLADARMALRTLACQLEALEAQQDANPHDWGIVGTMGHILKRLETLANNE